ncbi:MAG TPA: GNAT family N-acetyltransferase [bacterium]|nr:GNAT family N-acetyltransferase [bacterium]HPN42763.1 GNAT family N-acetyltransferase [bacterium]
MDIFTKRMLLQDIPQVNQLLSRAFTQGRKDDGFEYTHIPLCRQQFLEMYREECPDGCFVLQNSSQIVAAAFCHIWGQTGWIGPLAVEPDKHSGGLGKHLLMECLHFLKESGCTTIGLETNPRSNRNIGFYCKAGFVPDTLTADLIRRVHYDPDDKLASPFKIIFFSECSSDDQKEFCRVVFKLTQKITPNVDYSSLIHSLANFNFGESILLFHNTTPVAYCSYQTLSTSVEEDNYILRNIIFLAHPDVPVDYFGHFITVLDSIAANRDLDQLLFRVQLANNLVIRRMLEMNFKVIHTDQRMVLQDYPDKSRPNSLLLSRWV